MFLFDGRLRDSIKVFVFWSVLNISNVAAQPSSPVEQLLKENLKNCVDNYLELSDLTPEMKDDLVSPKALSEDDVPSYRFARASSLKGDDSLILNIDFKEKARKIIPKRRNGELSSSIWCLGFSSNNSVKSHNIGITDFDLPKEANLWLYSPNDQLFFGPYTGKDGCKAEGDKPVFWSPVVPGNRVLLFLLTPVDSRKPDMFIHTVNQGYRGLGAGNSRCQGSHEDVACQAGQPFRDQINSVALITYEGTKSCTGQMLNSDNMESDEHIGKPKDYFLTADHCVNKENACSLGFYWDYYAPKCRAGDDVTQYKFTPGGAKLVAEGFASDFALLELNQTPREDYKVFYAGWEWDADSIEHSGYKGTVSLHHPSADFMSIAVEDHLVISGGRGPRAPDRGEKNYWKVTNWEKGFPETGSSGACLWSKEGRCIGQLLGSWPTGQCVANKSSYFGKFSESWCNNENSSGECDHCTSLQPYLSPTKKGKKYINGTYYP